MTKITPTLLALIFIFSVVACSTPDLPPSAPRATVTAMPLTAEAPPATATATEIPATPTLEPIVTAGSEAALAGVPEGSVLGADNIYRFTNTVNNRVTEVGQIVDGKLVTPEFLNHKLVSCTASKEEILANEFGEFADNGGANRIAMLTDSEKFPEDVLLGQLIEKDHHTLTDGSTYDALRWGIDAQSTFNQQPEKMPHKIMGCFSRASEKDGFTYIGIVHKWKNSDGTYKYVTTYMRDTLFFNYSSDQLVFILGWYIPAKPPSDSTFIKELGVDLERNKILQMWVDQQSVPAAAEDYAFAAIGPEVNYFHH